MGAFELGIVELGIVELAGSTRAHGTTPSV